MTRMHVPLRRAKHLVIDYGCRRAVSVSWQSGRVKSRRTPVGPVGRDVVLLTVRSEVSRGVIPPDSATSHGGLEGRAHQCGSVRAWAVPDRCSDSAVEQVWIPVLQSTDRGGRLRLLRACYLAGVVEHRRARTSLMISVNGHSRLDDDSPPRTCPHLRVHQDAQSPTSFVRVSGSVRSKVSRSRRE
jgi:hypothetical protein